MVYVLRRNLCILCDPCVFKETFLPGTTLETQRQQIRKTQGKSRKVSSPSCPTLTKLNKIKSMDLPNSV